MIVGVEKWGLVPQCPTDRSHILRAIYLHEWRDLSSHTHNTVPSTQSNSPQIWLKQIASFCCRSRMSDFLAKNNNFQQVASSSSVRLHLHVMFVSDLWFLCSHPCQLEVQETPLSMITTVLQPIASNRAIITHIICVPLRYSSQNELNMHTNLSTCPLGCS